MTETAATVDSLLDRLRADQGERWHRGERPPAEEFVARLREHPGATDEQAVELVYAEVVQRRDAGEAVTADEYARRFPDLADRLREQMAFGAALAEATAPLTGEAPPPTAVDPPGAGAAAAADIPSSLGPYQVRRLLGRGGMGAVYLAHDPRLGRDVALKVPRLAGPDDERRARFTREARLAAGLRHPHLCPVYDVGEADGVPYLAMPYFAGPSLADWLAAKGPLPERAAAAVAYKVARALAAAHAAGVVHRDIKPANILLDARREPVVVDFGLARAAGLAGDGLSAPGGVLGTPAFLAPEQIGGDPAAQGPACDVYGLGATLFTMLTGRPPFAGPVSAVLRAALAEAPPPPSRLRPGLDPRLDALCRTALAKDPAERLPDMAAFAVALAEVVRGRPPRRGRWLGAVAVALIAAVGIAAVAVWLPFPPWGEGPGVRGEPPRGTAPHPQPLSPEGRGGPLTTPRSPVTAPDPLPPGSVWRGRYVFTAPAQYGRMNGDVELLITDRLGDAFRGRYRTDKGKYEWLVSGTLAADGAIRWDFTTAVRDNPDKSVVGKAVVTGRLVADRLEVEFAQPYHKPPTTATMWLNRVP